MEKFGIFELLDTLSAIMAPNPPEESAPAAATEQKKTAAAPSASAEITSPKQSDSAFAPPSFGGEEAAQANANRNALDSFLERHDAISKKIDHK